MLLEFENCSVLARGAWPTVIVLGLACAVCASSTGQAEPPPLFYYPLPYRFENGQRKVGPRKQWICGRSLLRCQRFRRWQGVVLMVYWSTLCPRANECDFDLIDRTISFWAAKQKKVVLDVVTIGFPIMTPTGAQGATPGWAMTEVSTCTVLTKGYWGRPAPGHCPLCPTFRIPRHPD